MKRASIYVGHSKLSLSLSLIVCVYVNIDFYDWFMGMLRYIDIPHAYIYIYSILYNPDFARESTVLCVIELNCLSLYTYMHVCVHVSEEDAYRSKGRTSAGELQTNPHGGDIRDDCFRQVHMFLETTRDLVVARFYLNVLARQRIL
jgi:hypothetical protein